MLKDSVLGWVAFLVFRSVTACNEELVKVMHFFHQGVCMMYAFRHSPDLLFGNQEAEQHRTQPVGSG